MAVDWSYYNKPEFDEIDRLYLPPRGEGDTMASQIVTAVNKLVYKWYNDGDVFDNTYNLAGWANDLSSYANWLHKYVPDTRLILEDISSCYSDSDYEDLLRDLADTVLDEEYLSIEGYADKPAVGSVYSEGGPFKFVEYDEAEDDDWSDEEDY